MRTALPLLALILTLGASTPIALAREVDLEAPLPVDPAIARMGVLENGMTYWIRPNQTPPGKVGLLLHIASGSLNETEEQRGVAHFLEHMAFNGSENFGPGEVVKFFESLGMQYGSDQNAMTSFGQTTYILYLPDNKKETVEKGLLYLSDVAFRLSLLPEEIDRERGVILEEARARSGAGMRLMEQILPILAPGSLLSQRIPIGLEEVIKSADRDVFLDYYRTWYRPEHSTLVVCGDVDVASMEEMLSRSLSPWERSGKPAAGADAGIKLTTGLRAAVLTDKEISEASVGVSILREAVPLNTVGDFRAGLIEQIGAIMMNRRLGRLVQEGNAPFQSARVGAQSVMGLSDYESLDLDASGAPEKSLEMLKAVIVEVRRASVHGFLDDELETAVRAIGSGLSMAAAQDATVDSMRRLMNLNQSVADGHKPFSMTQARDLSRAILPNLTLAEVNAAFAANVKLDTGLVVAVLPEKEGVAVPTEDDLLEAYREALAVKVEAVGGDEGEKGLLEKDPAPGTIAERTVDEDLDITSVVFENGVVVHVKPTDFQKDEVIVQVRLMGGTIEETKVNRGISMAAGVAFAPSMAASARHRASDLTDLLTGRKFSYGGGASDAATDLRLRGSPTEMDDAFRLLHLLLTEPKVEANSLDRFKQSYAQQLVQVESSVATRASLLVDEFVTGGDVRFQLPTREQMDGVTVEAAQAWIDHIVRWAPMEVAITGDIEADRAVELARRFLGSLHERPLKSPAIEALRQLRTVEGPQVRTVEVDTITPQAFVRFGWRGPARGMRKDFRTMLFASQIGTARLLKVIREEKGLTYSVQCAAGPATSYEGTAAFIGVFTAAPDKAEEAAGFAKAVLAGLVTEPPTDEEMQTVAAQLKVALGSQLLQPAVWSQILSSLRTRNRSLTDLKNLVTNYTSITREQIVETLGRYLTEDRYFQVIAIPKPKETEKE